ncbi:alpha/beta fold hydrolase [Microbacterium sp. B2969]|uniref:Alpha/beta fold hydrolase n=1 Tax=Microbacterium alkaliflavum TaxID=3248839 RepID=A0ABW7QCH3_9MICO
MKRVSWMAGGCVVVAVLLVAGCSSLGPDESSPANDDTTSSPTGSASVPPSGALGEVSLPVADGVDVDGLVAVDGHNLAVHCTGSGSPTVIILHGWIDQPRVTSHDYYGRLTGELKPDFRVCDYDRANVGDSDTVAGTQTPEMVVGDLDGVMEAIGDDGPYLLVGQSAGGMVASAYAVAHPEKVAGIVMVDASFDEEVTIEDVGMVPEGAGPCDPVNRKFDGEESLQKIDNCTMYKWAYERRDLRPRVPLVYLAAKRASWNHETAFGPEWPTAIVALMKSYAASWSPGKFEWVDSDHDIHLERPDIVADAVRWVAEQRHP